MSTQLKDMTFEVAQGALIRLVLVDSFCALAGIVAKVLQHREHDPYSTENPYANAATGLIAVFMILWLVVAAISALLVIAGKHTLESSYTHGLSLAVRSLAGSFVAPCRYGPVGSVIVCPF